MGITVATVQRHLLSVNIHTIALKEVLHLKSVLLDTWQPQLQAIEQLSTMHVLFVLQVTMVTILNVLTAQNVREVTIVRLVPSIRSNTNVGQVLTVLLDRPSL